MSVKLQRNKNDDAEFATSAKEVPEDKSKCNDDRDKSVLPNIQTKEEKKNKPQSTVLTEKDQPLIVKQRNGTSKPVQPKKVAQSTPYQIGETMSLEKSVKSQRNE